MRLSHVLVVIAVSFLPASEASLVAAASSHISSTAPGSTSQRLLRTSLTTAEAHADTEDRSLPVKEMKKLMKKLTTKEDFADMLGISKQMGRFHQGCSRYGSVHRSTTSTATLTI
ncbi:hypothetical protein F444_07512 [Phytophthora nicotianae P1976]|uniref:PexRD2 WYL domain-containing protein n=2 Tax=Phytophthora nicotianae TaxID=4792 RepID=A0A081AEE2_PHYNI|nr:hypothetical protein F444_07512 [Phytophthora nicotianae P1976]